MTNRPTNQPTKWPTDTPNYIGKSHIQLEYAYSLYFLFHVRQKVEETGGNEDAAGEAGGKADDKPPPFKRDNMTILKI